MLMRTTCLCLIYALFVACGVTGVRNSSQLTFQLKQKPVVFDVEIAQTPAQWEKGLMNRNYLAPNAGMLFVFPDQQIRYFWMKNVPISLDMIFMDAQKKVVGIIHS